VPSEYSKIDPIFVIRIR